MQAEDQSDQPKSCESALTIPPPFIPFSVRICIVPSHMAFFPIVRLSDTYLGCTCKAPFWSTLLKKRAVRLDEIVTSLPNLIKP